MEATDRPDEEPVRAPVRFPRGHPVIEEQPWGSDAVDRVVAVLGEGRCVEGRLEVEAANARVVCLIHHSAPYVAGIVDSAGFTRIPLAEFPLRAGQLDGAKCRLEKTEAALVLMEAAHFGRTPTVRASTRYVDLAHLIGALGEEGVDSAIALERNRERVLAFLHRGEPARLFGGESSGPSGGDILDRLLEHAFAAESGETVVEVFKDLHIEADVDIGISFDQLIHRLRPAPLITIGVRVAGDSRDLFSKVFVPPAMIIGRNRSAHVFLDNLGVSREHARMIWEDGSLFVEDLASGNGTRVNGEPVKRARLTPGDVVGIGKFELVVEKASDAAADHERTMLMNLGTDTQPVYLAGDDVFVEVGDVLIGKGPGVDVRAEGLFVKPVHARLESHMGGFKISCFGRASVRVNGSKTRFSPLIAGDEIQVGRTRLTLTSLETLRR